MKHLNRFFSKALPLIQKGGAAIVGAAIGILVAMVFYRAQPQIRILDITHSANNTAQFLDPSTEAIIPEPVRQSLSRSIWVDQTIFQRNSCKIDELLPALDAVSEDIESLTEQASVFTNDLPKIRSLIQRSNNLTPSESLDLFKLWEKNDDFIYRSALMSYYNGLLSLKWKNYKGKERLGQIRYLLNMTNAAGQVLHTVSVVHPEALNSTRCYPWNPEQAEESDFCRSIGRAVGYLDAPRLDSILKTAEDNSRQISLFEDIQQDVEEFKTSISRFAVSVLLSNSGGSSIAFQPYAVLTIETTGISTEDGNAMANDVNISLESRDAYNSLWPVAISPGTAEIVTFVAKDPMSELISGEVLLRAYSTGSLNCRMTLFAVGGGWFTKEVHLTPPLRFGKFHPKLPSA